MLPKDAEGEFSSLHPGLAGEELTITKLSTNDGRMFFKVLHA